jgi:NAD(P)-dependent dehydrogenase (short-subunit alcohol dehydrogenase family)
MTGSLAARMSMHGRRAVITGAAGHLGRVITETLLELGADVVLVDRDADALAAAVAPLVTTAGAVVETVVCDLEADAARRDLIDRLGAHAAGVSVLVNNAAFVGTSGLAGWATPLEEQRIDTWRRALEVNLTAAFDLTQGLLPALRRAQGPSVINVASIYGLVGPDWSLYDGTAMASPAAYAASKGGLLQLTRWMATTVAPAVRVNAITPGGIARGQPAAFVERYAARTPLRRMAVEDDFRGVVAFLASDMSAYVTGQNIAVDGGWTAW